MDRIEELARRVKEVTELDHDNEGSIEDAVSAIALTPLDVIEYLLDVIDNYTMEV